METCFFQLHDFIPHMAIHECIIDRSLGGGTGDAQGVIVELKPGIPHKAVLGIPEMKAAHEAVFGELPMTKALLTPRLVGTTIVPKIHPSPAMTYVLLPVSAEAWETGPYVLQAWGLLALQEQDLKTPSKWMFR
jgi:hypothetical protein